MADRRCRSAQRVTGAPGGVVAWVDFDQRADLLLMSADRFTTQEVQAIATILAAGDHSVRQIINALTEPGG